MGEINVPADNGRKPGIRRSRKLSTRVDLTPMVDMGFLLITFFIFSNEIESPKEMELMIPARGDSTVIGMSGALTLFLLSRNDIFYYQGKWEDARRQGAFGHTHYGPEGGLGDLIRAKQAALDQSGLGRKELILLIKPSPLSRYENVVRALDEVLINQVSRYAIVDISDWEKSMLQENNLRWSDAPSPTAGH